jgi:hypothetical protein
MTGADTAGAGEDYIVPETEPEDRPHCATCDVDMWLVRFVDKGRGSSAYVFECKVCGAQTTLSANTAHQCRVKDEL